MFLTEVRTDLASLHILEEAVVLSGSCRIVERVGKLVNGEPRWTAYVEHPYSWSLETLLEPLGYLGWKWYGYFFHAKPQAKAVA